MKKITLFSILAAFVAALSFTSCNTDSDNGYSPLSKDAQKNFQMAMSVGSYNDMVVLSKRRTMPMSRTRPTLCLHLYASA